MALVLAQVKAHIRVDHDHDDESIEGYIAAAEGYLDGIGVDMTADPRPAAIDHAVLLIVCHFYDHRDASMEKVARAFGLAIDRLVAPYREVTV